ncbi:MAG: DUF3575 domain-containing protein [Rikenellaceae bacterium]
MFKKLFLVVALLVCCNVLSASAFTPSPQRVVEDPISFDYISGDDHLYILYKDNRIGLDELREVVNENKEKIVEGDAHFAIISFIETDKVGNVQAINEASIQGSVVRSYLKTEYKIVNNCCAFMIDTTMNYKNIVYLQYVDDKMPSDENQAIYYSTTNNATKERNAISRYGANVPYISLAMYQAKLRGGVGTDGDVFVLEGDEWQETSSQQEVVEEVAEESAEDYSKFDTSVEEFVSAEIENPFKPVFALKTNLLYWAVANPNLGVEFYLGNNISLTLEGQYSLFSEILRKEDRAAYLWNADAEVKFWVLSNGDFDGLYFGLMGGMGQYDMKFGDYGHKGKYHNVGISVGYLYSFTKHFAMEFGLAGGYFGYTNTEYQYVEGVSVATSADAIDKEGWSVLPTKAQVSLVWRF